MGCVKGVTRRLRFFYGHHVRLVEFVGAVARSPITPARSLLQDCPASPLLLAGIIIVWAGVVRQAAPDVRFDFFPDDPTVWATGRGGHMHVRKNLSVGRDVDTSFCLVEHPDKRELFAKDEEAKDIMKDMIVDNGRVGMRFTLLGIDYECTEKSNRPVEDKAWKEAGRRCWRIETAIRGWGHAHRRKRWSGCLPKVLWKTAWETPPMEKISGLEGKIEASIGGVSHRRGHGFSKRSSILAWRTFLKPGVCPY